MLAIKIRNVLTVKKLMVCVAIIGLVACDNQTSDDGDHADNNGQAAVVLDGHENDDEQQGSDSSASSSRNGDSSANTDPAQLQESLSYEQHRYKQLTMFNEMLQRELYEANLKAASLQDLVRQSYTAPGPEIALAKVREYEHVGGEDAADNGDGSKFIYYLVLLNFNHDEVNDGVIKIAVAGTLDDDNHTISLTTPSVKLKEVAGVYGLLDLPQGFTASTFTVKYLTDKDDDDSVITSKQFNWSQLLT